MRSFLSMARLPWSIQGGLVCMVFLVVGIAVVGDYGLWLDSRDQRRNAERNWDFIVGDADRLDGLSQEHNRYYGVVFTLPLLLLERGLGLEDSRSFYLLWHLVTHAFFLVGGWCCSLLVYRLTRSRTVALFALLLFVLQPRLYAHSFFNSKDLPFLSMFMVTLYVTHWAFRKDTVGAFVLCGMCVGVLTNLRIMGMMLYPAVLALRGLDSVQTSREGGRGKHVVVTGAAFAVAGPCALYALSPYLWTNPFEFVTALQILAWHPTWTPQLFQGRLVEPRNLPAHYIPTWVVISTPPVTLLCAVLGGIRVALHSVRHPRAVLRNTDLRFGLLLVACLTLPVLAIIGLSSALYQDWRHVYFLHAPLCGVAGLGLQYAARRSRAAAGGVYALAGLGVLVTGVDMIQIHPHQYVYFNRLVDRTTPEYLRTHYSLDSNGCACREGLEFLRRRYPATTVYVSGFFTMTRALKILPQADRVWLIPVHHTPDVHISCGSALQKQEKKKRTSAPENVLYVRKIYNNTLLTVTARVTVPDRKRSVASMSADTYRGATDGRLMEQAMFDIYTYPGSRILGYARDQCRAADVRAPFFLHIVPVDAQELPAQRRQYGFDNRDFTFQRRGKQVAGRCWATVELPAYEIARVRTGQYTRRGEQLWGTELVGPIP